MEIIEVPENAKAARPWAHAVTIGKPYNVSEEACGAAPALVGPEEFDGHDGITHLRTYWKPTEEELDSLQKGGVVELTFIANVMQPHSVAVFPAENPDTPQEVARDAGSGQFVTKEYADENPGTTTVEKV